MQKMVQIPKIQDYKFKIHDFHCHFDENLESNLLQYNIQSCCIMPSWKNLHTFDFSIKNPTDFNNPQKYLDKLSKIEQEFKQWQGKIYKFIPVDFSLSKDEFCHILDEIQVAGIKLHPLQNFPIEKKALDPYLLPSIERKLILYIHTDWVPSTEFGQVKNRMADTFNKIAKLYPEIKIIMGHSGFNDSYVNIWKTLKKYQNVFAESSFAPAPQEMEKVILKTDPSRLLFGSSFPLSSTGSEIMKIIKMTRLSDSQKQAILFDNAQLLLKNQPYVEVNKS
jgi:predicted TIM-barrel fold metal-dependent hydrolase